MHSFEANSRITDSNPVPSAISWCVQDDFSFSNSSRPFLGVLMRHFGGIAASTIHIGGSEHWFARRAGKRALWGQILLSNSHFLHTDSPKQGDRALKRKWLLQLKEKKERNVMTTQSPQGTRSQRAVVPRSQASHKLSQSVTLKDLEARGRTRPNCPRAENISKSDAKMSPTALQIQQLGES